MQIVKFINATANFLLVSAAIYFAAVFPMQKLQEIVRKKKRHLQSPWKRYTFETDPGGFKQEIPRVRETGK
jgi:large-conductance mechanosensitive channel